MNVHLELQTLFMVKKKKIEFAHKLQQVILNSVPSDLVIINLRVYKLSRVSGE